MSRTEFERVESAMSNMRFKVKHTERLEGYWQRLAKNLMLDELLCGEADPTEWLKQTMIETANEIQAEAIQGRSDEFKRMFKVKQENTQ